MNKTMKVYPNPWGVNPAELMKPSKGHVANGMTADGIPGNVVMEEPVPGEPARANRNGCQLECAQGG